MGVAHDRTLGDCVDIFQDNNKDKACVNMQANPRRASKLISFFKKQSFPQTVAAVWGNAYFL
jgi:hypothetical protein